MKAVISFFHCQLLVLIWLACATSNIQLRHACASIVTFDTIAITGDTAPGSPQDSEILTFDHFDLTPTLNDSGHVSFGAFLNGPGVDDTNNRAVFSASSGKLALVAREGDPPPDMPSVTRFSTFSEPFIGNAGQTSFYARPIGPALNSTNNEALFSESDGVLRLSAREGNEAPGFGDGFFYGSMGRPAFNNAGQPAFTAQITGPGVNSANNTALFAQSGGKIGLVAREGDVAPVGEQEVYFGSFFGELRRPVINNAGHLAFTASLTGTDTTPVSSSGVFSGPGDALKLVARAGDAAPGVSPAVEFRAFGVPLLNAAGQTAFLATLSGANVDGSNSSAVFSQTHGTSSLVARQGDAAPGTEAGTTFGGFESLRLNNAGQTAFLASLSGEGVDGSNSSGIFAEFNGAVGLVARAGEQAPGTEPGVHFGNFNSFTRPHLNNLGQVAFLGSLNGPGVDDTNSAGIFATDTAGKLHLILRRGDLVDVDPDPAVTDNRTVEFVFFDDENDLGGLTFNDRGQLAVSMVFTDSTQGVFVATIGIPEPNTLVLFGAGMMAIAFRRG